MLAGRLHIPEVAGPSSIEEVLARSEHPVMLTRAAPALLAEMNEPQDLTLLIGPEGGWSEREQALTSVHASLGPRNLRADTSALVALSIALSRRP